MTDNLIPDIIENLLKRLKYFGADEADIVCFANNNLSISVRHGNLENIERSDSVILGIRAVTDKKQAVISISDIMDIKIDELASRVVSMAKSSPSDDMVLFADENMYAKNIRDLHLCDRVDLSELELEKNAQIAEHVAFENKMITNSEGAEASYGKNNIWLANSYGFSSFYKTSIYSISACVISEKDGLMERDFAYSSTRFFKDLKSPVLIGKEASERTVARCGAVRPRTCVVPVVFEPRISRNLVSALASAVNGSNIAKGTSFLKNSLGLYVCNSSISIVNDPFMLHGLGSRPFDAECIECKRFNIVENGRLENFILDLRSARQLGLNTTGNASRGASSVPSPSHHNLYIENGSIDTDNLLCDIKEGVFVTDVFGSGVNIITGDYSQGAAGFWIENGKITYPVNEFTIAGNLTDMFRNMIVANDLVFEYHVNSPTVRIDNLTIAGR